MMPLIYAQEGEPRIIKKIGGNPEVKKHLEDLGFTLMMALDVALG